MRGACSSRAGQQGSRGTQRARPSRGCGPAVGQAGAWGSSQEPVEQLSPEAQADGGVVDVEDEVLLRLEVQVRKRQLQVHHLDPAGEGQRQLDGQMDAGSRVCRQRAALTG